MAGRPGRRTEAGLREPAHCPMRHWTERLVKCGAIQVIAVVNKAMIDCPILGDVVMGVVPGKVHEALAVLVAGERVCYFEAESERGIRTIQVAASARLRIADAEREGNAWVIRRLRTSAYRHRAQRA